MRSQPQLVLIYRLWRDGRLSKRRCEVAQAEIRTCNLPITNAALYHTATSGVCLYLSVSLSVCHTRVYVSKRFKAIIKRFCRPGPIILAF